MGLTMYRLGWIFCLITSWAGAQDNLIRLASGLTVEPYIIQEQDAGFEADIVKAAFAARGYEVEFAYQPLSEAQASFRSESIDGVLTVKANYPEVAGTYLSDDYINYRNYAVSLTANDYVLNQIEALRPYRVIGFIQANMALGDDFKRMTQDNPLYIEMPNQRNQVEQLFKRETDVIIIDIRILTYYRNRLTHNPKNQPVNLHPLFETSHYKIAFRDAKIRDVFNSGLKEVRDSGMYDAIIDSYLSNPNL